jgi:hypothetical protein
MRSYKDSVAYKRSNRLRPDGQGYCFPLRLREQETANRAQASANKGN